MAFLGIEIGGTKLQVAVVSATGVVTATARGSVAAASGAAAVLDVLERLVAEAVSLAHEPLEAVGIGFGGPVDRVHGTVATSHQVTGWSGFPLMSWVAERTGLPTTLENDSNAAALAEAVVGAARGFHAVVYSNVGSGVGGGLVVGGRIYHGRVPGEMEIGHLRLAIDGPIIEDVVSGGDAKGQFMGDPASWSAPGRARLTHEQQWLKPETIALLRRADIFLADTTVGHRDWEGLKRSIPSKWCRNRVDHNTHAMVIRKREARKAVQNRPKRL